MKQNHKAVQYAILAAVLYAFSTPVSKYLLEYVSETMLAGLLYLGAGWGMLLVGVFSLNNKENEVKQKGFTKQ